MQRTGAIYEMLKTGKTANRRRRIKTERRTECVLIEKLQRAGEKAKRKHVRILQVYSPCGHKHLACRYNLT